MMFALAGLLLFVACEKGSQQSGKGALTITSSSEVTIGKYAAEFVIDYTADAEAEVALSSEWLRIRKHHTGIVNARLADSIKNRHSRSSLRLAVIGIAHYAVVADYVGIYIVRCVIVLLAHLFNARERFRFALNGPYSSDEARLFLYVFY
mgnify:CR=1 FL=1